MVNRFVYLARHGEAIDDGDLSARGREQARLLGRRLASVPLTAVHHGPLSRATQTARLVTEQLPGVPVHCSEIVGDYVPPVPDLDALPAVFAQFLDGVTADEYAAGATLAADAIDQHTALSPVDTHELIITHSFLIAWFVRHALDAPAARWLGLNAANCALTVIHYRPERPPALLTFNDSSHLPAELRWTGFPPDLHV
ncbi:histidine phosphatase family protein [Actinoplanes sp. NPDC051859]|uniref:histidine phosphatase family protein n=1 Tax=Actinoplanes sp. NPDC051859 TaxID=3363909 RepID=UPI0037B523CC